MTKIPTEWVNTIPGNLYSLQMEPLNKMLEQISFPGMKSADNNKLHLQSSLADKAQQVSLEFYKNIKPKHIYTFAASETVSQLPPLRENFPLPIRTRISSGVSLGPLANGV